MAPDLQPVVTFLARAAPMAAALAVFITVIAYIHSARLKVLVFCLPIPFTCAYLMLWLEGRQTINATHLAGLALSSGYHWLVYLLHGRRGWPLLAVIGLSAGLYVLITSQLRFLSGQPVGWAAAGFALFWLLGWRLYRPMLEPGQRATAPWPIKLAVTFTLALGIFTMTSLMAGAVTTFPYAGVFTSYEMRRCLRTLAGQYMINIAAFAAMMMTIWCFQMWWRLPEPWPLLPGWLAVASVLLLLYGLKLGQPSAVMIAVPAGASTESDEKRP
jgi:hypothetical protein